MGMAKKMDTSITTMYTAMIARPGNERLRVQALAKGLTVLQVFDSLRPEWSVDEIARETGYPKMVAYRLVKTLEEARYLVADPTTNRYHLGPALWAAYFASSKRVQDLVKFARPYLEELAARTKEAVSLTVDLDGVAMDVDSIPTARPFVPVLASGRIIENAATASGKILAAHKSAEEIAAFVNACLKSTMGNPGTDFDTLTAELQQAREEGVAYDLEGSFPGVCSVAAPVMDQGGRAIASLVVIVPPGRFGSTERLAHTEAVKAVAISLSSFMGYSRETPSQATRG
jgi:DNA-binding IclR family transcriptional regulator